MNIWAWVHEIRQRLERGDLREQRLAELMNELPSAAVDEAHDRVDSMVDELLRDGCVPPLLVAGVALGLLRVVR